MKKRVLSTLNMVSVAAVFASGFTCYRYPNKTALALVLAGVWLMLFVLANYERR